MASNTAYHNANANTNSPYGSGDPYYSASTGYITPAPMKKRTSNWIKIGVPVLIVVIIAAVVGGVLGSRAHNNKNASTSGSARNPSFRSHVQHPADARSQTGRRARAQR